MFSVQHVSLLIVRGRPCYASRLSITLALFRVSRNLELVTLVLSRGSAFTLLRSHDGKGLDIRQIGKPGKEFTFADAGAVHYINLGFESDNRMLCGHYIQEAKGQKSGSWLGCTYGRQMSGLNIGHGRGFFGQI